MILNQLSWSYCTYVGVRRARARALYNWIASKKAPRLCCIGDSPVYNNGSYVPSLCKPFLLNKAFSAKTRYDTILKRIILSYKPWYWRDLNIRWGLCVSTDSKHTDTKTDYCNPRRVGLTMFDILAAMHACIINSIKFSQVQMVFCNLTIDISTSWLTCHCNCQVTYLTYQVIGKRECKSRATAVWYEQVSRIRICPNQISHGKSQQQSLVQCIPFPS